jgi:hypothetical protein
MNETMREIKKRQCPFCAGDFTEGFVIISGGVWWCEEQEALQSHISGRPTGDSESVSSQMHCLVSSKGYRSNETWPKKCFYCRECHSFATRAKEV